MILIDWDSLDGDIIVTAETYKPGSPKKTWFTFYCKIESGAELTGPYKQKYIEKIAECNAALRGGMYGFTEVIKVRQARKTPEYTPRLAKKAAGND